VLAPLYPKEANVLYQTHDSKETRHKYTHVHVSWVLSRKLNKGKSPPKKISALRNSCKGQIFKDPAIPNLGIKNLNQKGQLSIIILQIPDKSHLF
jgi:hypothetical protein